MTTKYPAQATVTKALRRDAGIIAMPRNRAGYHVTGSKWAPTSIFVDLVDDISRAAQRQNTRAAADLYDHLKACGWEVEHDGERVLVSRVPTAAERRKMDV